MKPTPVSIVVRQMQLSMRVKTLQKKMNLLKMSGPQIRFSLFTFRPIALEELSSLTTIDTFSLLADPEVTHPLWVQEVPCSIPGSCKDFYD